MLETSGVQPAAGWTAPVRGVFPIPLWFHQTALLVLLVSDAVFSSRINRIIEHPIGQQVTLSVFIASILTYAAVCWLNRRATILLILLAGYGILVLACYQFQYISGMPQALTTTFQFLPVLTFVVFFGAADYGLSDFTLRWTIRIATAYTLFYILLAVGHQAGIIPNALLQPLLLNDVERGDRLFGYGSAQSLALFYWMICFRRKRTLLSAAFLVISIVSLALALSRVFSGCLLLLTFIYVFNVPIRFARYASLAVFLLASAGYFYGYIDVDFNPFAAFSNDSSGGARAIEYDQARTLLFDHPWLGGGLSTTAYDIGFLTGNYYFSSGDLGIIGIWFDFGVIGLILYLAASYICCLPISSLRSEYRGAVFLTGCVLVMFGCIAPNLFSPGGSTYFALILGIWLQNRDARA